MALARKEQERFEELARVFGDRLACFYCCIAFDVPYDVVDAPRKNNKSTEKWTQYREKLRSKGKDRDGERERHFLDGETDVEKVLLKNIPAKGDDEEEETLIGTKFQRKAWGKGDEKNPYSESDYKRLDALYSTYSSRLNAAGGPDAQQEYILRLVSRMSLDLEKALATGATEKAQRLNKMIQDNLASENLRKKDARPIDDVRIDAITDRLEKAGLLKDGKQCSPDEMFKILFGRVPKYTYTKDAAEQIILINENRMRNNDSLPELSTLPDSMRLEDKLGEFAKTPNAQEKEIYEKLGLVKFPAKGNKAPAKTEQ